MCWVDSSYKDRVTVSVWPPATLKYLAVHGGYFQLQKNCAPRKALRTKHPLTCNKARWCGWEWRLLFDQWTSQYNQDCRGVLFCLSQKLNVLFSWREHFHALCSLKEESWSNNFLVQIELLYVLDCYRKDMHILGIKFTPIASPL